MCKLSSDQYSEYIILKKKDKPMKKVLRYGLKHCPICDYVVDNLVPKQHYCDRCGQRLKF